MKIEDKLVTSVISGLKTLYGQGIPEKMVQMQKTKKELEGHLTLAVFPSLKMSKKGSERTTQEIDEYLKVNDPAVAAFNVIKGFLNPTIASATWIELLNEIQADKQYGLIQVIDASPLVMIEYSSPNTNKPLHLGHVRSNLLGNALTNIVAANGNKAVRTNIINDCGTHIYKSMLARKKYGNDETPETPGKKGGHLMGDYYVSSDRHYKVEARELMAKFTVQGMSDDEAKAKAETEFSLMQEAYEVLTKWEADDSEICGLWEMMNNWAYTGFDETYKRMGISSDKIYYESNTCLEGKEKVTEGLEKGFFYKKENDSVWADLAAEGLDHKLLLRSDGTSVHMIQDIGTAKLRSTDCPTNRMVHVVGNEQNYHLWVLSILLDKLGFEWGKGLVHFSYGMVELPEDKTKPRRGTIVDADDLMEEMIATAKETLQELGKLDGLTQEEANDTTRIVDLGTLKYFIPKVDTRKDVTLNPKESIDFSGNTGPLIQYTYTRIQPVLQKVVESGIVIPEQIPAGIELSKKEEGLIQMVTDFATVVEQAGKGYSPSTVANYIYDLVKEYNQFYHNYSILREENGVVEILRIALSANVAKVVRLGMNLLGIGVPSRM